MCVDDLARDTCATPKAIFHASSRYRTSTAFSRYVTLDAETGGSQVTF